MFYCNPKTTDYLMSKLSQQNLPFITFQTDNTLFSFKRISQHIPIYQHSSPGDWIIKLKGTRILPQSIFSALSFKWRPEEYIVCLSLCRHCLQKTRALGWCQREMWRNTVLPGFSHSLWPATPKQSHKNKLPWKRECSVVRRWLNGSSVLTVPLAYSSLFPNWNGQKTLPSPGSH